jgi:hypothetical protein
MNEILTPRNIRYHQIVGLKTLIKKYYIYLIIQFSFIRYIIRLVSITRAQILLIFFSVLALGHFDQTKEIYRAYAQQPGKYYNQIIFAVFGIIFATLLCCRLASERMKSREAEIDIDREIRFFGVSFTRLLRTTVFFWPTILSTLIPLSAAYGLMQAVHDAKEIGELFSSHISTSSEIIKQLTALADSVNRNELFINIISIALFLFSIGMLGARAYFGDYIPTLFFNYYFFTSRIVLYGLLAIIISIFLAFPITAPMLIGTIGIFMLFIAFASLAITDLTAVYDRHQFPALTCICATILAFSIAGWNASIIDTRSVATRENSVPLSASADEAFQHWLETRQNRSDFPDEYPVFLIAAAGGGHYAAAHAAYVLARMQDRCSWFAHHTFALSGVSGGSLGISIFSALAQSQATPKEKGCSRRGSSNFESLTRQ